MKKLILSALLFSTFTGVAMASLENKSGHQYQNEIYTEAVKIETSILNGERDGSLKKPQVHQLLHQVNTVEDRLEDDTLNKQFGQPEANGVESTLQQIKKEMQLDRQANLGHS